jgi:hypothetical protein
LTRSDPLADLDAFPPSKYGPLQIIKAFITIPHRYSSHMVKLADQDSRSLFYRRTWKATIFAMSALCLYLVVSNLLTYVAFYTVSTLTVSTEVSADSLTFPAVTICNNNVLMDVDEDDDYALPQYLHRLCNTPIDDSNFQEAMEECGRTRILLSLLRLTLFASTGFQTSQVRGGASAEKVLLLRPRRAKRVQRGCCCFGPGE